MRSFERRRGDVTFSQVNAPEIGVGQIGVDEAGPPSSHQVIGESQEPDLAGITAHRPVGEVSDADREHEARHAALISALRQADRLDDASDVALVLVRDCRAVGDRRRLADALVNGANVDQDADRWEAARERYIEAMEIYRKLNLPTEQADCLDALGVIGRHDGLLDFAAKMHAEAIRLYEGRHHEADKAAAHYNLAITQLQTGCFADAFANAKLATGVRGSTLDPAVVMAAAIDVIGDRAEADRLRTEFIERNGVECFNKELALLA